MQDKLGFEIGGGVALPGVDLTGSGTVQVGGLTPSMLAGLHRTSLAAPSMVQGLDDDWVLPIPPEEFHRRSKRAYYLAYRKFQSAGDLYRVLEQGATVCIVGAGPSLANDLELIREMEADKCVILALNNAHDVLLDAGIKPDLCMVIEARERASRYITPREEVGYLIGTSVDDALLERLKPFARNTYLFHVMQSQAHREQIAKLNKNFKTRPLPGITGGTSVGIRAFDFVTQFLGAPDVRFFGFDSSGTRDDMHAKAKDFGAVKASTPAQLIAPDGQRFRRIYPTTKAMLRQAGEFWDTVAARATQVRKGEIRPFYIRFYGRGLLPDWAACLGFHIDSAAIKAELEGEGYEGQQKGFEPQQAPAQQLTQEDLAALSEGLDLAQFDISKLNPGAPRAEGAAEGATPEGGADAARPGAGDAVSTDDAVDVGEP